MTKKKNNIIKFPSSISKIERKIEAILFAAAEPLDLETIEKRLETKVDIKKILEKIQNDFKGRGINLICIRKLASRVRALKIISIRKPGSRFLVLKIISIRKQEPETLWGPGRIGVLVGLSC